MEEIWKDIRDYEELYQVSNLGKIKSLERLTTYSYELGGKHKIPEKELKSHKNKWGYLKCYLYKDGIKKEYSVHRLVAQAFIPNPKNLPQVNHIDKNKENNCANNLEWCNCQYNVRHSISKKVRGINIKTGQQIYFDTMIDAKKLGFNNKLISLCCLGKKKTHKGYKWKFE